MSQQVTTTERMSSIKATLDPHKEIVVKAHSFLCWDVDWYPMVTGGVLTSIFLLIWYLDPTFLTLFATFGMLFTLADYLMPKITAQFISPDSWTGVKEKRFDQACEDVASAFSCVTSSIQLYSDTKEKRPIIHFLATVGGLLSLAYIGNKFNSFFLSYCLCMFLALLPGLHRKGLLKKVYAQTTLKIAELAKGKDHMKKAE